MIDSKPGAFEALLTLSPTKHQTLKTLKPSAFPEPFIGTLVHPSEEACIEPLEEYFA